MLNLSFHSSRAQGMLARLQQHVPDTVDKVVEDLAEFFRRRLLDETIAGAPGTLFVATSNSRTVVGVQTGNLRRSFAIIEKEGPFTVIRSQQGIAPYAQDVAETVHTIHGRDFLRITQHFYEPAMRKAFAEAMRELVEAVTSGRHYTYRIPRRIAV